MDDSGVDQSENYPKEQTQDKEATKELIEVAQRTEVDASEENNPVI